MPHSIIIIGDKAECVSDKVQQLANYAEDLDGALDTLSGKAHEDAHELLERVQGFLAALCDGTAITGNLTLDGLIGDMETALNI